MLREAAWFDALHFVRERLLQRRNDASSAVVARLTEGADRLARAARTIAGQPTISPPQPEVVTLTGPDMLQPTEDALQSFTIDVERVASGTTNKIWITVEHDPELVELIVPPQLNLYDSAKTGLELGRSSTDAAIRFDQLQAASMQAPPEKNAAQSLEAARQAADKARLAAEYPYDPQRGGLPANFDLNVGEARSLTFQIRRRANSAGRTKVILRAISGTSFVRHEIRIALPALDQIALVVADGGGAWSVAPDGLTLHPRPNRTTNYEFQLVNQGGVERTVDVEFVAPESRPASSLPVGLRTLETSEVLALVGAAKSLVKIDELKLPADGRPVTLAAPRPKEPANAGLTTEERNRAETTVGKTATDDKQPAVSIRHGMLVIVRRRDTGETLVRRLDFRPERPRRYVRPARRLQRGDRAHRNQRHAHRPHDRTDRRHRRPLRVSRAACAAPWPSCKARSPHPTTPPRCSSKRRSAKAACSGFISPSTAIRGRSFTTCRVRERRPTCPKPATCWKRESCPPRPRPWFELRSIRCRCGSKSTRHPARSSRIKTCSKWASTATAIVTFPAKSCCDCTRIGKPTSRW
ncbi:MAG: hypothetical protein QM775_10765 [Pirellulales bacterium]